MLVKKIVGKKNVSQNLSKLTGLTSEIELYLYHFVIIVKIAGSECIEAGIDYSENDLEQLSNIVSAEECAVHVPVEIMKDVYTSLGMGTPMSVL